jgi:hypothetical protein
LIFSGGDDDGAQPPGDVVKAYLADLAKGDAKSALALGSTAPANTDLVTPDILKKQQETAKISDVKVVESETAKYEGKDHARVHVTYTFGNRQADARYLLTKVKKWLLDETVVEIDLGSARVPGLTIFGVDVSARDKAYVFPGPVEWGSSNGYLSIKNRSTTYATDPTGSDYPDLDTSLSDAGKQAVNKAMGEFFTNCAKSNAIRVEDCDLSIYPDDYRLTAVDETAKWKPPTDLTGLSITVSSYDGLKARISGDVTFSVTYKARNYQTEKVTTQTGTDKAYLYGTIDLAKTPLTFEPS